MGVRQCGLSKSRSEIEKKVTFEDAFVLFGDEGVFFHGSDDEEEFSSESWNWVHERNIFEEKLKLFQIIILSLKARF